MFVLCVMCQLKIVFWTSWKVSHYQSKLLYIFFRVSIACLNTVIVLVYANHCQIFAVHFWDVVLDYCALLEFETPGVYPTDYNMHFVSFKILLHFAILAIFCHASACVCLFYFVFDAWDCDLYWWIFGFCSVFPIFSEIVVIIQVAVFKKGIWDVSYFYLEHSTSGMLTNVICWKCCFFFIKPERHAV